MSALDCFTTRRRSRPTAAVAVAALLATALLASAPAAAHVDGSTPSFLVDLEANGDARITVTSTFDLETDDERDAFRTLQNDADARASARDRFRERMAAVASDASNATGRQMGVADAGIELSTADGGSVGVVRLSVTWRNLAAVEGDRLVVTEPFASGFEPGRPFTVRAPDGHELAGATPAPDETGDGTATWSADTDLSGFEVVAAPSGEGSDESGGGDRDDAGGGSGIGAPGFGAGTAVLALLAAAAAVRRR